MTEKRRYDLEGLVIDIPVYFDEKANVYIEDYPDFIKDPIWTPKGHRVFFSGMDACALSEERTPGGCPDCGSCKFFKRAAEHTWFGYCINEKNKKSI